MNDAREPKALDQRAYDAEITLAKAFDNLASAHGNLASTYLDYPTEVKAQYEVDAETCFDTAEELFEKVFSDTNVHVARYTENPNLYKVALGAILEATQYDVSGLLARRICKILSIEPNRMINAYQKWKA